jgi:hypothetical protein
MCELCNHHIALSLLSHTHSHPGFYCAAIVPLPGGRVNALPCLSLLPARAPLLLPPAEAVAWDDRQPLVQAMLRRDEGCRCWHRRRLRPRWISLWGPQYGLEARARQSALYVYRTIVTVEPLERGHEFGRRAVRTVEVEEAKCVALQRFKCSCGGGVTATLRGRRDNFFEPDCNGRQAKVGRHELENAFHRGESVQRAVVRQKPVRCHLCWLPTER